VASDTRVRLIRTTGRLLRRQGYAATGLNQVMAEAEAPKGSMYFHFPGGKEELAAAALDNFAERVSAYTRRVLDESGSVREAVVRFVDDHAARLEKTDFAEGCAVATVAVESLPGQDELTAATGRALTLWVDDFAASLQAEGHDPEAAHRLATLVVTVIEGGIVMAKGRRSVEPLLASRDALLPLFTPPAGPASDQSRP
jgi:TetR/AcrR family transcriptional regulator, lmrAB and yxaGH operons repressor